MMSDSKDNTMNEHLKNVEALVRPYTPTVAQGQQWEFGIPGWVRGKDGALVCVDKEEMAKQNGVLTDLVKQLGSALLKGKSAINLSLPVRVFEPRSVLQRLSDSWCYAPLHLTRAAVATDPVERIKWCITFFVAGLHRNTTNAKPFNPILGETWQAEYADGSSLMMEQISHHPPVSQFELVGPDNIFHYHGYHEFAACFRPNWLVGQQIGPNVIDFIDGGKVEFQMPHAIIYGTMWGERRFEWVGSAEFHDRKNNVHASFDFNPDGKGGFVSLFVSAKSPIDTVRGVVYRLRDQNAKDEEANRETIAKISGSWLDGISFDDKWYWKKQTVAPFTPVPIKNPLPSDSRYRKDLDMLLNGQDDEAQYWKEVLENKQRRDRKLRKTYAGSFGY